MNLPLPKKIPSLIIAILYVLLLPAHSGFAQQQKHTNVSATQLMHSWEKLDSATTHLNQYHLSGKVTELDMVKINGKQVPPATSLWTSVRSGQKIRWDVSGVRGHYVAIYNGAAWTFFRDVEGTRGGYTSDQPDNEKRSKIKEVIDNLSVFPVTPSDLIKDPLQSATNEDIVKTVHDNLSKYSVHDIIEPGTGNLVVMSLTTKDDSTLPQQITFVQKGEMFLPVEISNVRLIHNVRGGQIIKIPDYTTLGNVVFPSGYNFSDGFFKDGQWESVRSITAKLALRGLRSEDKQSFTFNFPDDATFYKEDKHGNVYGAHSATSPQTNESGRLRITILLLSTITLLGLGLLLRRRIARSSSLDE